MLDRNAARSDGPSPPGREVLPSDGRRRLAPVVAFGALAVLLHLLVLDRVAGGAVDAQDPAVAAMRVRAVAATARAEPGRETTIVEAGATAAAEQPSEQPPARTPPVRSTAERSRGGERASDRAAIKASTGSSLSPARSGTALPPAFAMEPEAMAGEAPAAAASATVDVALASVNADPPAAASAASDAFAASAPSTSSATDPGSLPGAGNEPPPTYTTALPPKATLHYEVRRGFLRGEGEIRWQPDGGRYRLVLEARVAGLTLLTQTSEGSVEAVGLAPDRFLDQRARRSAQAANFVRDRGRIMYSGSTVAWPLLAGSQDRLSWMVQLAGIAQAHPELLVDGGRITMAVTGARGDAAVWTLRCTGVEQAETAHGPVRAVKLVREGRSAYDTTAEIWLDPERGYLPAHATLRNSGGGSEYDLLLDRIDP